MSKSGICSSILWNFNLLKLAAIIQNFIFTFNLTSLDHVPFLLLFLLGLSFWTSHESMWELYFPSLFSWVSHERMQEGFTKQERKNEGHKPPSSCFVAFSLDIGLSIFWLCNAIVRSWAKLSLQSQARWWSWRSLVFTRWGACPLVLPQVINLAGICIDKISLRRRGKPATSHVLYGINCWKHVLWTCMYNSPMFTGSFSAI
jgi:hypothetical protein